MPPTRAAVDRDAGSTITRTLDGLDGLQPDADRETTAFGHLRAGIAGTKLAGHLQQFEGEIPKMLRGVEKRRRASLWVGLHGGNNIVMTTRIGLVSISDRASQGVYQDLGLPGLKEWLATALTTPWSAVERLIPDEQDLIRQTLIELVDTQHCDLVFTTGGTGPAPRDVTPEATLAVADREMPGFGEQMRQISLHYVPTAILSRQVGVIRGHAMIINLPGQPKAIAETLGGVRDAEGHILVHGIFAAIPYGLELIGGPSIHTDPAVCQAFRPKKK